MAALSESGGHCPGNHKEMGPSPCLRPFWRPQTWCAIWSLSHRRISVFHAGVKPGASALSLSKSLPCGFRHFSHCCGKVSDKNNFMQKEFFIDRGCRPSWKCWWQEFVAAGHISAIARKWREINTHVLCPLRQSRTPPHQWCPLLRGDSSLFR